MADSKPRVPGGQGKMGAPTMPMPIKSGSNGASNPGGMPHRGSSDFKSGTSGRKTWPNISK